MMLAMVCGIKLLCNSGQYTMNQERGPQPTGSITTGDCTRSLNGSIQGHRNLKPSRHSTAPVQFHRQWNGDCYNDGYSPREAVVSGAGLTASEPSPRSCSRFLCRGRAALCPW